MRNFFLLLRRFYVLLLFLLLQVISITLLVRYNKSQQAKYMELATTSRAVSTRSILM